MLSLAENKEVTTPRIELTGFVTPESIEVEDNGRAKIASPDWGYEGEGDGCFFVRLQSWHDGTAAERKHPFFDGLAGKKVRVIVETVD